MKKQVTGIICVLVVIMICLTGCSIFDEFEYKNADIPKDETVITRENVVSYIDSLKIKFNSLALIEGEVPAREAQNAQNVQASVMYEMPDIDDYAPTVVGKSNGVNVEIVFPIEDNNSAASKLVIEAAKRFNETHSDSSITLRIMEPTLANDFIKSGAYLPDGYIATNAINEYQLKESGIKVKEISDRLLGNTVGIVVSENTYNQLKAYYGEASYELETVGLNQYYMRVVKGDINYDGIFKACLDGKVKIGYLNPINNPTGLNFVVSMLSYFDSTNPFSMEASTDFSEFQNTAKVYFSLTQMREAFNRGNIDAFTLDYQSYYNSSLSNYVFIPFGLRQDYPLIALGNTAVEAEAVLSEFANIFINDLSELASSYGFDKHDEYNSKINSKYYDGLVNEILSFWKDNKASGKKIAVYFVCDVSGSMRGRKIEALKKSALNAMQYIGENSLVGLICYNGSVFHCVPLGEFNEHQQKYFAGAVNSWSADGGTATNNAILMALKELDSAEKQYDEIIPLIILLSDGYTESGYSLDSVRKFIDVFDVPIYTIGYEANVKELEAIASINNGVFINASTDDVGYILKNLFNSEI